MFSKDLIVDHYELLRNQMPEEIGPDDLTAFDAFDGQCIDGTAQRFGITSREVADIVYNQ